MPVINKPKKIRTKVLLILLRGVEKTVLENDRENTVYSRLIGLMQRVEAEVLTVDDTYWSMDHAEAWLKFEAVEAAFKGSPIEGELDTLADDLETALDAI